MLHASLLTYALAASFTDYPGFLDHGRVVEAFTDRGPIIELIVKCPNGTGIMSYSKIEGLYCSSKHTCFDYLRPAVHDTCR